jgi:hypothetical protein
MAWRRVGGCVGLFGGSSPRPQTQRILDIYPAVYNLFNLGRHLVPAEHYRNLKVSAFGHWVETVS